MYAKHYHQYKPAVNTNIMDTLRKFGFVPPSETAEAHAKWKYYKECGWNNEKDAPSGV